MKKKPQLLHKLLMRTTASCNFCSKVVRVKKFVKYVIRDNCWKMTYIYRKVYRDFLAHFFAF